MSWVTVIWSVAAGVCLTLGSIHLLVWLRDRTATANLLFSVSAAGAVVLSMLELAVMRAQTPAEYGAILRWMHVSAGVTLISIVWFIHHYLGTGRPWLAWLFTGLRGVVLLLSLSPFAGPTFQEIQALRDVSFLGETLSAPIGETSPWRILIRLSMLLFLIYTLDAAFASWKLGRQRQAIALGLSVSLLIILAGTTSGLMVRGILPSPLIALVFLVVLLAMAFELSVDLVRAKKLSRELQESEQRMRLAARAANLGYWDWDIERDEIWIDEVAKERIAVPEGRASSSRERYWSLIHPGDLDTLRKTLDEAVEQDGIFNSEFRMNDPRGDERWIAVCGRVDRPERGEPRRLRGISIDITARKQSESELQEHRKALAHSQRVFAMSQLSAALAHELNQPLGAILRNAEAGELFLRRDPPDIEELREIFVDIQRDDHRAVAVIDRMRALLTHRELHFEVIVLRDLVGEVAGLLNSEIQARNAALEINVCPTLPDVRGDRVHLQQVLVNLLFNSLDALDASPESAQRIEISAGRVESGGVELAVRDTGPGIEPERLTDLFELFVTTKSEGSGIGLAISKTIVEAHGGSIRAENHPGGGACIRVTLPPARSEATA